MKITQLDLRRTYENFNDFFDNIIKDDKVAIWFAQILGKSVRSIYYYGDPEKTSNDLKAWDICVLPPKYYRITRSFLDEKHKELYGDQHFDLNGEIKDEFVEIVKFLSQIMERWDKNEPITKSHQDGFMQIVEKLFAEIEEKQK